MENSTRFNDIDLLQEAQICWAFPSDREYTYFESPALYPVANGEEPNQNFNPATNPEVSSNCTIDVEYSAPTGQYIVQQKVDANSMPNKMTHQQAAAVQWLMEHFEISARTSLPRSTIYGHYLKHSLDNKLEPFNAASFGKLIRSVFLDLKTRRLGTRGNSKYHYQGIQLKPSSPLKNIEASSSKVTLNLSYADNSQATTVRQSDSSDTTRSNGSLLQQGVAYLGEASNAIPAFPEIYFQESLPEDCVYEDVDTLKSIYREHLEAFLDAILSLDFNTVETLWREFWRSQYDDNGDECEEENYFSKSKLFSLCSLEPVQTFIKQVDLMFYQNLIQILVPDILKPFPVSHVQSIWSFANNLDNWLKSAMVDAPPSMLQIKLTTAYAFSSGLQAHTKLNHVMQASKAVLQNRIRTGQMLADLNNVDFKRIRKQAAWFFGCHDEIISRFENEFKLNLQKQSSLEDWTCWLESVTKSALKPYEGLPTFSKRARELVIKWSFFSCMVITDLSFRSAITFGSFHLIRLLNDEYMTHIIKNQIARATGLLPIAVMLEDTKEDLVQNHPSVYGANEPYFFPTDQSRM
ncbi:unnamed protein product [Ceutorhynchus assimilis]|uniref:RFX-type winged-helix domain-containing protein n=1 Tax=Ceutorhynchus assimilis TaxID=467358 RepID=A0A9N9QKE7_9CUCU|nr:unnamed protein product [Ceutorhynchus assimilis]